jgi:hypothetical protein
LVAKLVDEARAEFADLSVEEIDVAEHPDVAVKYGVMATPAIAINGRLEFRGVPREGTLLARLRAAAGEREPG